MRDDILKQGELEELTNFMIERIIIHMLGNILEKRHLEFNKNFDTLVKLGLEKEVVYKMLVSKTLDLKNGGEIIESLKRNW